MNRKYTIEEIKELFSRTVFWNWLKPVDGSLYDPIRHGTEHVLTVMDLPPGYRQPDDGKDGFLLIRHEAGDLSLDVAEIKARPDGDAEFQLVTGKDDAEFIAAMPVIIPFLLRRIDRMEKTFRNIIEWNRTHAQNKYGDAEKAESWPCILASRAALDNSIDLELAACTRRMFIDVCRLADFTLVELVEEWPDARSVTHRQKLPFVGFSDLINELSSLIKRWDPQSIALRRVGLGQMVSEHLQTRFPGIAQFDESRVAVPDMVPPGH